MKPWQNPGTIISGSNAMHGTQSTGTPPGHSRRPAAAAFVVVVVGTATILGAYFFQYVIGLPPCPLCLDQRIAFYVSIPLALLVAVAANRGAPRSLVAAGLGVIALVMLFNAGLAVYHAGVEWKLWPGPQECSGPLADLTAGGDLLSQISHIALVRCDEAAWRFLGLSLAGYDVLISLALAGIAAWGALGTRLKPAPRS
jgi:disulfide bond formation protein DsbB